MPREPNSTELAHLESRGYNQALLKKEGILILEGEIYQNHGAEIRASTPRILWTATAMSGQVIGLQTRETQEHKYRYYAAAKSQHLPMLYGTGEDHDLLYDTGEMIITEGAFDRIALKNCFPDKACYARLSKGAANQLAIFIRRYAKTLWVIFDMDGPGQKAAQQTQTLFSPHLNVYCINYPRKDPSELLQTWGLRRTREHFQRQMELAF